MQPALKPKPDGVLSQGSAQPQPNPIYRLGSHLKNRGVAYSTKIAMTLEIPYDANMAILLTNYCMEVRAANRDYKLFKTPDNNYIARPQNSKEAVFELFFTDEKIYLKFQHCEDAFCKAYAQKFTDYLTVQK